ncbi:hypothetical protein KFK09_001902 [Dendrobium nobile]|uniref:Uncharacterized protein n=1 Tax=Dendrobium nobile TaxID=94219 RepID=A0A8T3C9K5_DENNO|nr:hypothetical protein KFK09_001902 [Dendrobium nobile]
MGEDTNDAVCTIPRQNFSRICGILAGFERYYNRFSGDVKMVKNGRRLAMVGGPMDVQRSSVGIVQNQARTFSSSPPAFGDGVSVIPQGSKSSVRTGIFINEGGLLSSKKIPEVARKGKTVVDEDTLDIQFNIGKLLGKLLDSNTKEEAFPSMIQYYKKQDDKMEVEEGCGSDKAMADTGDGIPKMVVVTMKEVT